MICKRRRKEWKKERKKGKAQLWLQTIEMRKEIWKSRKRTQNTKPQREKDRKSLNKIIMAWQLKVGKQICILDIHSHWSNVKRLTINYRAGVDAIKHIYGSNLRKNHRKQMSGAIKLNKIEKNCFTEK